MKAVIFGSNGQDGRYLKKILSLINIITISCSRSESDYTGDVSNLAFVQKVLKKERPDYIFHFAANSTTSHSAVFDNFDAISSGTINIIEMTRVICPQAKIFISGSALQFENNGNPISHESPFSNSSIYALLRNNSIMTARYYRSQFNMNIYIGYFFNHDSELRSERHINQKIIQTAKRIKNGSDEILEIGSIEVQKEFNHASDIMEAIWILINQDKVFECCIGSGVSYSIKDWIELSFSYLDLDWKEHITLSNNFTPEYNRLVSDSSIIRSLGWSPKISIKDQVKLMMEST